jgi:hypothetical protein
MDQNKKVKKMKSKEQRYLELYEQVKTLVEVTETEVRLSKLFPQTQLQVGKDVKEIEKMKTKNVGKKGKYHSVIKMKRSSIVGKSDPQQEEQIPEEEVQSGVNDGTMSPEESIRAMQDPSTMVQEMLSQGASEEEIIQYLASQGMSEEDIQALFQQLQTPQE